MGVPRGLNTLPPGAAVGDPVELKRAFQDQLRRELGARAGDIHSTLGDRRVARAPSRKMTAAGAPGAQYILDGDVRARQTLEPALGLPQLTAVKLATFADDVESRVGREKQSADWAASADAASGAPGLTKPDVKLGAGGSGGGARAFRFRKAMYGAPLGAPGATARERAAAGPPGFRAARGPPPSRSPAVTRSGRAARPRAADAFPRGQPRGRVASTSRASPAPGTVNPRFPVRRRPRMTAPRLKPRRRRRTTSRTRPTPSPRTRPGPSRSRRTRRPKKRVPASLLSGRSRARGRAAPRPARLAAGQPDAPRPPRARWRRRRRRRGPPAATRRPTGSRWRRSTPRSVRTRRRFRRV